MQRPTSVSKTESPEQAQVYSPGETVVLDLARFGVAIQSRHLVLSAGAPQLLHSAWQERHLTPDRTVPLWHAHCTYSLPTISVRVAVSAQFTHLVLSPAMPHPPVPQYPEQPVTIWHTALIGLYCAFNWHLHTFFPNFDVSIYGSTSDPSQWCAHLLESPISRHSPPHSL